MAKVCDDHSPIIITRKSAQPVVMMSLEDFEAHILRTCLERIAADRIQGFIG